MWDLTVSVPDHFLSFYFGLVLLWFGFFEIRRGFAFDVFFFSISSRLIERSSALHTLQYFDGLPSLSLLVKAVFSLFIKYRM